MPALGWLHHDAAATAATGPRTGGAGFDVAELLATRATVYLLGAEETQTAPLVSALTGHIAREARRIAAFQPGGRLDPPLTLALDEAALICPVPLHQWTADMGGRGVTIIGAFQSRAQLLDRYGEARAEVILNNSGAVMVFGGTRSREDLTYWSTLGGERDEPTLTTDMHGRVASRTTRRVPVLAPAQIANLPAETVVAFRRGMPPVIGRVELAYRRLDVRAHQTPVAWTVRAQLDAIAVRGWLLGWLGRHLGPVCGVPFGIWAGFRWDTWLAVQVDSSWALLGALAGILLGGVYGWWAGGFVAAQSGPVRAWLARHWAALWALLTRLWRARVTHYRPRDIDPVTQPLTVVPARDDQS